MTVTSHRGGQEYLQIFTYLQGVIHTVHVPLNLFKQGLCSTTAAQASCQPSTMWHTPDEQSSLPV